MPNLIHSVEHAFPAMCEGQAKIYLERTIPQLFGRSLPHTKLWTMAEGDRYFDVYQVTDMDSARRERFYFDVSAFFGKAGLQESVQWKDLPLATRAYSLVSLFTREELSLATTSERTDLCDWINDFEVRFKQFSSEQIGQRIATLSRRSRTIEVVPVRMYMNEDIPFLHGSRFYKLFMLHQICHWQQGHDARLTELGPRRDGRAPRPGVDCIAFRPLQPYDYARDFLNFHFWTHQPDAFDDPAEVSAFTDTARYAIQSQVFTARELRVALGEAGLAPRLRSQLRSALEIEPMRAQNWSAPEHHVAH